MDWPLPPPSLAALGALVYLAGLVDSLAGGGGLITLPAYLAFGVPPGLVLGTNKCSSAVGTAVSVARYFRALSLSPRAAVPMVAAALGGSALGALAALRLDPAFLRYFLLFALPPVAWSVLTKHHYSLGDRSGELESDRLTLRSVAVALPVGAYDGFFGPGTGTFLALGLNRFCRYDLLKATGYAKAMNLASNLAALAAFLAAGKVHLAVGLPMAGMSVLGHWTGSHLGLKRGAAVIRPAVALVCAGLFARLLLDVL